MGPDVAARAFADAEAEQARLLDEICAGSSGCEVLVATIGEACVGFVSFSIDDEGRTGEIGLNAVHPEHAGRGIGSRLYERALAAMKARGVAVVTVATGGDPSHAAARRAYEKAGFGTPIPSMTLYKLL